MEEAILEYMQAQNRPFIASTVMDNLQSAIPKMITQKVLERLAERGSLSSKMYNKSRVFWANQEQLQVASEEELQRMDEQLEELKEQVRRRSEEVKAKESAASLLQSSLTDEQLERRHLELRMENDRAQAKLESLRASGIKVSPKARQELEQRLRKYKSLWRERRKMALEMVSQVSEGMERKPSEIMEDAGCETDEAAGALLASCPV